MSGTDESARELTASQRAIVEAPAGRVVLLGAAGSGKSLVLAERAARLIRSGVQPDRVLLLATSRRAALRLGSSVRERTDSSLTASSFHGLALAILRQRASELGYHRPPELLTTASHFHLLRTLLAAEDSARWPRHAGSLGSDALRRHAYDLVMGSAENGLDLPELR